MTTTTIKPTHKTARNSHFLAMVKRIFNAKVFKHTSFLLNTDGDDAARAYLRTFFAAPSDANLEAFIAEHFGTGNLTMIDTRKARKEADEHERNGDALSLKNQVHDCCDWLDTLTEILADITDAWLKWGPVDDGTPQGDKFDEMLSLGLGASRSWRQRRRRRKSKPE
jgi:hypothetical protein